jgi:hypothetical protein
LEAVVLVLPTELIYEVHCRYGLTCYNIYTKFHEDWLGYSGNIKAIISTM